MNATPAPIAPPEPDFALVCVRAQHAAKLAALCAGRTFTMADAAAIVREHCDPKKTEKANGDPKAPAALRRAPVTTTDEEWLATLETNTAYSGIDVKRELGKCQAWAATAKVKVSRRRFVNWLNKAEPTVSYSGAGKSSNWKAVPHGPIYTVEVAPPGWQMILRNYVDGIREEMVDQYCAGEWLAISEGVRGQIIKAMR